MSSGKLETRLQRLAVEEDTCTLAEFQTQAEKLRSDPGFEPALESLHALANEKRLLTVTLLRDHASLCACEIQAALACSNPTVTHHMARLIDAGLVDAEKRGKWKHYRLTPQGDRLLDEVLP